MGDVATKAKKTVVGKSIETPVGAEPACAACATVPIRPKLIGVILSTYSPPIRASTT